MLYIHGMPSCSALIYDISGSGDTKGREPEIPWHFNVFFPYNQGRAEMMVPSGNVSPGMSVVEDKRIMVYNTDRYSDRRASAAGGSRGW